MVDITGAIRWTYGSKGEHVSKFEVAILFFFFFFVTLRKLPFIFDGLTLDWM